MRRAKNQQLKILRADERQKWTEQSPTPARIERYIRGALTRTERAVFDSVVGLIPKRLRSADKLHLAAMYAQELVRWRENAEAGLDDSARAQRVQNCIRLIRQLWVDNTTAPDRVKREVENVVDGPLGALVRR